MSAEDIHKKPKSRPVRVRFAPSPTGYLHVGGARTALYNYLYAKKHQGTLVLRIEDTDLARSTDESLRMQMEDLTWLGLHWDEGPELLTLADRGRFGPYRQSQRQGIYKQYAEKLLKENRAYYCFCSNELLEQKKQIAVAAGQPPHYDGTCRNLPREAAERRLHAGERAAIRFWVKEVKDYSFDDLIRGRVVFPSSMVGDFVMLRSDGMPVYNFCCVIDDALMEISHVLRAEEHLSNTLRQMMLYEAFGFVQPEFGHLSIILGHDRQKLSKRHGATSCNEYRLRGYLPEALNNFIALLGWSSPTGQEVLSRQEMTDQFSLDRLNPASAVFDEAKLRWMNAQHLRALPPAELWKRLVPFLAAEGLVLDEDDAWQERVVEVFKSSMETIQDGVALLRPLAEYHVSPEGTEVLRWPTSGNVIDSWIAELKKINQPYLSEINFTAIQDQVEKQCGVSGKNLFQPIRVMVVGTPQGTELKNLVTLLKVSKLIERAEKCRSF